MTPCMNLMNRMACVVVLDTVSYAFGTTWHTPAGFRPEQAG